MASTPLQIFTVDSTTGNVWINGNLFVRSAENKNSWIVGDMIKANAIIQLANGCIVFNGTNGTITVKDPDNVNSGTYTYINNGVLNQYLEGTLIRSLTGIESGQVNNNSTITLSNTYNATPSVFVSPKNLQMYYSNYPKQNQTFNCNTTVSSLGSNKYSIKPVATVSVAAATDTATAPGKYSFFDHSGEIVKSQSDVGLGSLYEPGLASSGKSCTMTTATTTTGTNCNKIVVSVTTRGLANKMEAGLVNNTYPLVAATHKWRIKYKLTSASSWSYSSWSSTTTAEWNKNYTSSITQSLTAGNYNVAVEFVLTRSGSTVLYSRPTTGTGATTEGAYVLVNSITCTRPAATLTPSGTFNYIAVGR